jgi:arylsulfatase A-like enzyme
MPFIARWPGNIPSGKVDDTTVLSGVDFLPTLCSLAGVALPHDLGLDGEDLSAALLGNPVKRETPLFWEFRFGVAGHVLNKSPMLSARKGDWKLLMNPDRSRVELYHIPEDPSELDNLAKEETDVVDSLSEQLLTWSQSLPGEIKDTGAGGNGYPWPK